MAKISSEELKWRAESDAETLARYQEILEDPKRKAAAIKAAKSRADDLTKRANVLKKAAGGPIKRK